MNEIAHNAKDDAIKERWNKVYKNDIDHVCEILRKHDGAMHDFLAHAVASLCNVDFNEMMTSTDKMHISQARWFFWYSYRYMTKEPFGKIVELTQRYGRKFTEQGISHSVNKMLVMIETQHVWKTRWNVIKRFIKLGQENNNDIDLSPDKKIIIQIPREYKDVIVKIEYR